MDYRATQDQGRKTTHVRKHRSLLNPPRITWYTENGNTICIANGEADCMALIHASK